MAVLSRINSQLEIIAKALDKANIPYEIRGPEHSPASDLISMPETNNRKIDESVANAVALSTIHRSKGLEFQCVAAVGWAEGILPNYNSQTPAEIAEEKRLAYVALSRADNSLFISYSRAKDDERFPDRQPSRFLGPVDVAVQEIQQRNAPVTGADRKARLAAIRAELEAAGQENS
jgi:DNA helicase-2/ATP-dependent DNA helicase PcrA